jgi:hypothetical protein
MDTWTDSRITVELQSTAGHIGSSIQQLYYAINRAPDGSMKITLDTPPLIEGRAYTTTLSHITNLDSSYKLMNVTLKLIGTKDQTSASVTLGSDADWEDNLTFSSTANSPSLIATKSANSVMFSFGGMT